jgi:hypothetical protein
MTCYCMGMTDERLTAAVQYQIDEFELPFGEAVSNVADELGLTWDAVAEAAATAKD